VAAAEYCALQNQVHELQRLLAKNTLEDEALREALDLVQPKNGYCARPRRCRTTRREGHRRCAWGRTLKPSRPSDYRRAAAARGRGRVAVERPDTHWCPDGFESGCDNGDRVRVAFHTRLLRPRSDLLAGDDRRYRERRRSPPCCASNRSATRCSRRRSRRQRRRCGSLGLRLALSGAARESLIDQSAKSYYLRGIA
jgi:hypothetical protein